MRASKSTSYRIKHPGPKAPTPFHVYKLNPKHAVRLSSKNTPIWKKENSSRTWQLLCLLVFVTLLAFATWGHASPPRSRGARPIALGNGYTSVSGDLYSLFYNPGGLHAITRKEVTTDFGRSYSIGESARTDFNGILGVPWKWREKYIPLAFGFYGEQPTPGSHIIDLTAGAAMEAPMERWSRGIILLPSTVGLALTIRHQNGEDRTNRVGSSAIALGLTGGLHMKIDRKHQVGFALRHLYAGDGDPKGPSLNMGVTRKHKSYLTMMLDLEYARGGTFRFQPGMEWILLRGLLRPRLGWGFRDNGGVDSVATGVGFYLSPYQVDISYLLPVKTLADNSGQFRASLSYRFGRPQFTEIYYDHALEAASSLDQNVLSLTVREAELKSSLAELEQKLRVAREELGSSKSRIEALKDKDILSRKDEEIRKLKIEIGNLKSRLSSQRIQNKQLRKKKATYKTHVVKSGDTLQSLAAKYYGDPSAWKKIYNANADKIERGLPRVGSKLVIP